MPGAMSPVKLSKAMLSSLSYRLGAVKPTWMGVKSGNTEDCVLRMDVLVMKDRLDFFNICLLLLQFYWLRSHEVVVSDSSAYEDFIFGIYDFKDFWHWMIMLGLTLGVFFTALVHLIQKSDNGKALKSSLMGIATLEAIFLIVLVYSRFF